MRPTNQPNDDDDGTDQPAHGNEHVPIPSVIFVYGTLCHGNDPRASLTGFSVDRTGNYPTITPDDPSVGVDGQLRQVVDRASLRRLDGYEGVPHLYTRVALTKTVHTYIGDPELLRCDVADHAFDHDALQAHADEHAELHINDRAGDVMTR